MAESLVMSGGISREQKADWLDNSATFDRLAQTLFVKFQRKIKLVKDGENFFRDVGSEDSRWNIFAPIMSQLGVSVNSLQQDNLQTLVDLVTELAKIKQASCQSDVQTPHTTSSLFQFGDRLCETFVQSAPSPRSQKSASIVEIFDVIPFQQSQGQQDQYVNYDTVCRMSATNYLFKQSRNIQILSTSLIGQQQKSPLLLDVKYPFSNKVSSACALSQNKLCVGTLAGEVLIFDIQKNRVVHEI